MIHRFGDFELDEALYQLRRGGDVVKIEPKVFDVLVYLVRHRDRVVSKDELLAKLWPGEYVSESVLPRCITGAAEGRSATTAAGRQTIQTVHGRGYRFVARGRDRRVDADRRRRHGERPPPDDGDDDVARRLRRARRDHGGAAHGARATRAPGAAGSSSSSGEPGIGKTRTAEEIGAVARRRGAIVLTGRCYEGEGAPAFWPWVQILRAAASTPWDGERARGRARIRRPPTSRSSCPSSATAHRRDRGTPPCRPSRRASASSTASRVSCARRAHAAARARARRPALGRQAVAAAAAVPGARDARPRALLVLGDVSRRRAPPPASARAGARRARARAALLPASCLRGLGRADVARFIELTAGRPPAAPALARRSTT